MQKEFLLLCFTPRNAEWLLLRPSRQLELFAVTSMTLRPREFCVRAAETPCKRSLIASHYVSRDGVGPLRVKVCARMSGVPSAGACYRPIRASGRSRHIVIAARFPSRSVKPWKVTDIVRIVKLVFLRCRARCPRALVLDRLVRRGAFAVRPRGRLCILAATEQKPIFRVPGPPSQPEENSQAPHEQPHDDRGPDYETNLGSCAQSLAPLCVVDGQDGNVHRRGGRSRRDLLYRGRWLWQSHRCLVADRWQDGEMQAIVTAGPCVRPKVEPAGIGRLEVELDQSGGIER